MNQLKSFDQKTESLFSNENVSYHRLQETLDRQNVENKPPLELELSTINDKFSYQFHGNATSVTPFDSSKTSFIPQTYNQPIQVEQLQFFSQQKDYLTSNTTNDFSLVRPGLNYSDRSQQIDQTHILSTDFSIASFKKSAFPSADDYRNTNLNANQWQNNNKNQFLEKGFGFESVNRNFMFNNQIDNVYSNGEDAINAVEISQKNNQNPILHTVPPAICASTDTNQLNFLQPFKPTAEYTVHSTSLNYEDNYPIFLKSPGNYRKWAREEDELLLNAVKQFGSKGAWNEISSVLKNRTAVQCSTRYFGALNSSILKGKWTAEEDRILLNVIQEKLRSTALSDINWIEISSFVAGRTSVQCMARYREALDPSVRKGRWTEQEADSLLRQGMAEFGRRWVKIAEIVGARTQRQCRTRWLQICPKLKTMEKVPYKSVVKN